MWNNRELKRKAKKALKKNYGKSVVICFLIVFFAAGYGGLETENTNLNINVEGDDVISFRLPTVSEQMEKIRESKYTGEETDKKNVDKYGLVYATKGAIAKTINHAVSSGSIALGLLGALNEFLFNNRIIEGVVIILGTGISFLYWFFISNILIVGEKRFFLENRTYEDTEVNNVLFIYKTNHTMNVAIIMFKRFLFNALWFLTIIGGFIKYYSYLMIPYILAENPNISSKEAFELSKEMMKGKKFKTFLLDLSFLPWGFLCLITLNIVGFLYVNPYETATKVELYYVLREKAINNKVKNYEYLNDTYLLEKPEESLTVYPSPLSNLRLTNRFSKLNIDYKRDYKLQSLILLFFSFGFVGWAWEVFLYLFSTGSFVNRGVLIGPWLPIYGTGGVLMIVLLKRWIGKPIHTFILIMLLAAALEYSTSWVLEKIFNVRWWDYTNYFLNINGRICLEGLVFFGAGGCLLIYVIAPLLDELYSTIPSNFKKNLCMSLCFIFIIDIIVAGFKPNTGAGITSEIYNIEENINYKKGYNIKVL